MAIFLVIILLLQLRPVQTFLAQKVLLEISKKTDHEISIDRVKISWLDRASLEQILVKDLENDTLLYSRSVEVNYSIKNIINGEFLSLEEVSANDLRLKLIKYDSASKINLSQFLNALKKNTTKKESKPLYVDQVDLKNLKFSLRNKAKEPDRSKLDFANLRFGIPDINVAELSLVSDTISGDIIQMSGVERNSGFTISEFNTKFYLSNKSLSVDNLNFRTPTSHISDSLEFFFNGLDDLGHFVDSVSFILHFENSLISHEDLKIVLGTDKVNEDIAIDGIIWGTVGDFNIEETRFGYGKSYFVGGVSCFGLPNIKETFILADLTDSHVIPSDLRPYIGDYADNLRQMGKIDFTGSFAGFLKDFVARGNFVTDQGSVHTDINLKIPENPNNMSYDGSLEFKDLNVGAFFQNQIAQVVNLKATINGKGIVPENAEFDLRALIYNSGLNGYVYDSVEVDGKFAKNFFEGQFSVSDPNCALDGIAQIDFRQIHEVLNVNMNVEKINVDELKLSSQHISAQGKIQLEVKDIDIDDFTGSLAIDSGFISIDDKEVDLDSIRVSANFEDSTRVIKMAFPGFNSTLEGKFKISNALKDIPIMASSYAKKLKLTNDTTNHETSGENYKLSLNAKIDNISEYLDSLKLPFDFGGATLIESTFRQSKNANVSIYIKSDTFTLGTNEFHQPVLEINGSTDLEASDILTNFILESSKQVFDRMPNTEDLLLEGIWYDNNIDLTTHISQPSTASDVRIESSLVLSSDSIVIKMLPSDIKLLNDNWTFNPTNKVVITKQKASISNFEIYDSSESIVVEGVYADSTQTNIEVSTEDLNMNKVSLFSDAEIKGFLNGNFKMFKQTSKDPFKFDGAFLLKNLIYDDLAVGDISGSSEWNPVKKSIYTKVNVERENVNAIEVEGYYFPSQITEQLDFAIKFDDADLKMGEPFLKENFSEIEGVASGALKISGTVAQPRVLGSFKILNGGLKVDYLNTSYSFAGQVNFDPNTISLSNFDLVDRKGSNAIVTGAVQHRSFENFISDITIRANNFEFLNTTSLDNSLYYGSAYGTGIINITGPLNDLNIKANIKTEADTRFFVPVSEGTAVGQEEYITFVNFADTTRAVVEEDFKISGLTLDFDIEVTPDAYCELIFDIKTGDIIRGRGRGNLKLRLDTDGDFNMFGPLEITEGAYNLTIVNLLSKEFDVVPGSRITWYGDPYNAIIDLNATYQQRASFEGLKNPDDQDPSLLSQKVPVSVILELDGGMLSPQIGFDLQLQNESDATNENIPALSQIRNDEQELKRQVISLLILKRFSPRESFTLGGGNSFGNSVSEFVSSQVSYLVSQIDENLEVEVNLADIDDENFNTFQLRFAYTFLNGRLKVTRGGDFGSQDDNNTNVLNDLVGDWSVEYSLTKDGRLRAKVFSNSDQRIQVNENQQNQELGISLRFVHSFNDISELLTIKRDEALLRREEEETIEEEGKAESDPKQSLDR
ncbi:translocation/assembly module TamB domain-containing protein [Ekhidna sp. To15]|uniref:translocation/assembly module TamB domain-containing protein n=1 Tax=Ekhidna sp. To15 TaxID=3395267 RepID=UPI003F52576A